MTQSLEDRAADILRAMAAEPASKAASGRYVRSSDRRPGVRLWATTQQRYGRDLVGVQFYGRSRIDGEALAPLLEQRGFEKRTPQAGQLTFAKPVDYARDGGIDVDAVARVRREIDAVVDEPTRAPSPQPARSFRDFMLASPLAEIELPMISREGPWRETKV